MVNLQTLVDAPLPVLVHVATVVPAFFLGAWLLVFSTKGARHHRRIGKAYLTLMAITAVAAIFIRSFSGWSVSVGPLKLGLIHLFVPLTVHGVYGALATITAGDIAGLLAFAPGRIMYRMFAG